MPPLQQPPTPNPYFAHPPPSNIQQPPYPGPVPPPNSYGSMPQTSTPQPGQPAALGNLPPNLLALLQSAQQQQAQPPLQQPAPTSYGMTPQQMMNSPPSNANANPNAQYQQLMAYLVCLVSHLTLIHNIDQCFFSNRRQQANARNK
jgi:hypothetical protein